MRHKKMFFKVGVLLLSLLLLSGLVGCGAISSLVTTPTPTATSTPTVTPTPTATSTPTVTPTPTATPTPTPLPTRITDARGVPMVLVPAGEFTMGSNDGKADEKPPHTVYLNAFYIDQYEVTYARYRECVNAGHCKIRPFALDVLKKSGYGNPQFDNYPMNFIEWEEAKTYCQWRGARLPTEAEWEKAARGTDGRLYPWGNMLAVDLVNSREGGKGSTTPVGSYPSGASPYGALDMAGNVAEWVADWYDPNYYAISPRNNPTGPISGRINVFRGGSYDDDKFGVRATTRFHTDLGFAILGANNYVGFRCARSP